MKLATFTAGGPPEIGIVLDGKIVSISRAAPSLAVNMIELIARWPMVEREVRAIGEAGSETLAMSDLRLLAPIPRPGKIFAIGLNYADHIAESGMGTP
ncbi:MAG TPA: 5-carboxymethyl-2-hydroxymuconate isomerase, partial [Phenylobacterium sp.]